MIPIEHDKYYHIYNRGINSGKIFYDKQDYLHFLELASIYIDPIAEAFAYALISNHFHFLIRIKDDNEIGYLHPKYAKTDDLHLKWKTYFPKSEEEKQLTGFERKPVPEKMLQHLFSTYVKGFNKKYNRTGALLEHPFERILVDNERYLKRLILYIHNNPIKHGFCDNTLVYPWTSYMSIISIKPSKLLRNTVIDLFDNKSNFKALHCKRDDYSDIGFLFMED